MVTCHILRKIFTEMKNEKIRQIMQHALVASSEGGGFILVAATETQTMVMDVASNTELSLKV